MARSSPIRVSSCTLSLEKGCWHPRILDPSEWGYYDEPSDTLSSVDLNRIFEFHYALLDGVQVETPLVFVNHEARDIALAWARTHGLEICQETPFPIFARRFNTFRDILYVPTEQWDEFYVEPYNRASEDDMVDKTHSTWNRALRLAVPESLFRKDTESLEDLDSYFPTKVLYVIIDTPPDFSSTNNDMNVQSRWELRKLPAGAFIWSDEKKSFEVGESEGTWDDSLHDLLTKVGKEIGVEIIDKTSLLTEIRPVFAIKG